MRLRLTLLRFSSLIVTLALLVTLAITAQLPVSITAQTDTPGSGLYIWNPGTTDLSERYKSTPLSIVTGLAGGDEFHYVCTASGDAVVTAGDVATTSSGFSAVKLLIKLEEKTGADKDQGFDAEARYTSMQIEQQLGADTWSLAAETGGEDTTSEVYRNGVKVSEPRAYGLPNAGSVKSEMNKPVAFGSISKRGVLSAAAHRFDLGDSKAFDSTQSYATDVPARLVDPFVFIRLLFPGIAGAEAKLDGSINTRAVLATNVAGEAGNGYAVSLTLRKVFGDGETARSAHFDFRAVPDAGATIETGGMKISAPVLEGTLVADVSKGVVGSATLRAEYDSRVGEVSAKGTLRLRMDLAHKKD